MSQALAVREQMQAPTSTLEFVPTQRGNSLMLEPIADIEKILERHSLLLHYRDRVLKKDLDYGAIPGAGDKMVLLKPGAEKIDLLFGLRPTYEIIERIEDWAGRDHDGEAFFHYLVLCRLLRGQTVVSEHMGSCNSWETKYRYRKAERVCPGCGQEAIRKSKQDDGWYCWRKIGGCGATYAENDRAIGGQEVGRKSNPDVADVVNTILKMAQKRAHIAATLAATLAGEFFTVEAEDYEFQNTPFQGAPDDAPRANNGSTQTTAPPARNGSSARPQSGAPASASASTPPGTKTPRFQELCTEAFNRNWAVENGAVNKFRLLNAIRAGGFKHEAITSENLEEARAAMRRHYEAQGGADASTHASTHTGTQQNAGASGDIGEGETVDGKDSDDDMWPSAEVGESEAFQGFIELCERNDLDFKSLAGRGAFENAFGELIGELVLIRQMTVSDFQEANKFILDGTLRW